MLILNVPLGGALSFAQVSFCLIKELCKRGEKILIFPIGNVDLSPYKVDEGLAQYIQNAIQNAPKKYKRTDQCLKLWHINSGWDHICDKSNLLTFHEVDAIQDAEYQILKQQDRVLVTNSYTKQVFEDYGLDNISLVPLGFDSETFYETGVTYLDNDILVWNLLGKLESRKNTLQVLSLWAKKYGNLRNHRLNVACFNQFLDPKVQENQIAQVLQKPYYNITFLGHMRENSLINDTLNCADISLNLSSAEGYDLPCMQALGLGKTVLASNCTAHKDYLNDKNSILVEPSGKRIAADGVFFHQNSSFNCGNWHSISDEAILEGFEKAEKSIQIVDGKKKSIYYEEAKKIVNDFNYSKTLDIILENLK